MQCILCKSDAFSPIYDQKKWKILRCNNCGLVKTHIGKMVGYHHYHRDEEYYEESAIFSNIFKKRYNILSTIKSPPGKILDVGASTGTMLDIFKNAGYETFGIEPSKSFKIAQSKGHNIVNTTIEKARMPKNHFDIVIINHTLEHVADPLKVLHIIHSILKPGGILYIDVPNFGSLSSKLSGSHWKYLLPHEHIHHFEKETLKKLVNKARFTKIECLTWSGIYDVANPIKLIWYKLTHLKKSVFGDVIGVPGNTIATLLNRGTNLVIIAKK